VSADAARKVPGTSGDVVKVVDSMPGVGRAAPGSGALVVWGAAPEDTRVYVDGVRLPMLYHLGGVRSVLASDLVHSIELIPGGYGAAYGRGLGGIVLVTSKVGQGDGVHGSASIDMIDAAASARARISEKWRAAAAVRRSHLDAVVGAFSDRDVGELFPIPRYWDGQLRVSYDVSTRERVELAALASSDRVDRVIASSDPARVRRDRREVDFFRVWMRYRKELSEGAVVEVVPFSGTDHARRVDSFGAVGTEVNVDSTVIGLRASHRVRATKWLTTALGIDFELISSQLTRAGSTALPAREGDPRVFGAAPPDRINADKWKTLAATVAPFVEGDVALFDDKLHVVPGLRLDPYVTSVSRRTPVEGDTPPIGLYTFDLDVDPRLAIRYAPTNRVKFHAAYGKYRQPPQTQDLSAVFGNPALPPSRATHYVIGCAFNFNKTLSTELTVFHSRSEELPTRSALSSPLLAEALVPAGSGRVFGTQLLLRKELSSRFFGWISWTILHSERRDRENTTWRLFDYDQSHVVNAVAAVDLGRGFEVGLRARYATGLPRTPVVSASYDSRRDLYQPVFGPVNSTRLPAFVQVDLRVSKRFRLARDSELETYLDVQNVSNRQNAEEVIYDQTFTKKGFIRGVPILPVLGARLTW
jgi:outer membrane receptor protein involved in Fe transport